MEKHVKNIKIAQNLQMDVILLIRLINDRNVNKKFQQAIFYFGRENNVFPKTFQTDISNYKVASLLKRISCLT